MHLNIAFFVCQMNNIQCRYLSLMKAAKKPCRRFYFVSICENTHFIIRKERSFKLFKSTYLIDVFAALSKRYHDQPEFLQAVEEFLSSIDLLVDKVGHEPANRSGGLPQARLPLEEVHRSGPPGGESPCLQACASSPPSAPPHTSGRKGAGRK